MEHPVTIRPRLTLVNRPWGFPGHANLVYIKESSLSALPPVLFVRIQDDLALYNPARCSIPRAELSLSQIITPARLDSYPALKPPCPSLKKHPSSGQPGSYDAGPQRCPSVASRSTPMIHETRSQARQPPLRLPLRQHPPAQSKSAPRSNVSTIDRRLSKPRSWEVRR